MTALGFILTISSSFFGAVSQQAGTVTPEQSPPILLQKCTKAGCEVEQAALVLDANWRWVHNVGGYTNCYDNGWNQEFCPDTETCKQNCAVEGVTAEGYAATYGVQNVTGGVELKYVAPGGNVGSRLYVTDGGESYKMFMLLNREFTLDVDVSSLECGLNGAVYFVEMDALGGKGKDAGNGAGAKYGTGYCDAQCPHEKFERNETLGICCVEMDIWEANKRSAAYTSHPCSTVGPTRCSGIDCGYGDNGERWKGLCDKDGCDMNAHRMGSPNYYGPGSNFTVDTTKPLTVVTQFLTSDGTDNGFLTEIRRLYLQDGKLILNSNSTTPGVVGNSIMDGFCNSQKAAFGDFDHHQVKGGLKSMGEALKRGMVLSLSVWDDYSTEMRWLDSTFPPGDTSGRLGVERGPCDASTSSPGYLRKQCTDAYVRYTSLKYGEIGTTFSIPSSRRLALPVHV